MKLIIKFIIIYSVAILFVSCGQYQLKPIVIKKSTKKIDYLKEVKPILDKRCAVCHSCYNSPCQLKLSSLDGLYRGGSKISVYGTRIRAIKPTRLFVDATTTQEWREKGFHTVLADDNEDILNNSLLARVLQHKKNYPKSKGKYRPEEDKLICSKNISEFSSYVEKHPHSGMPYGFPQLTQDEYDTILQWINQGGNPSSKIEEDKIKYPSLEAAKYIRKWEMFLNQNDFKHKLTARYLYEHLFIAHLYFSDLKDEYYEIVRSKTQYPKPIDIIPTVRPYDDPNGIFYYRIRKIPSTIVHKTHMIFNASMDKLDEIDKLFIKNKWLSEKGTIEYKKPENSNPYITFWKIPPKIRYQFLLSNVEYVIRTFIRGPVCKGQIALNVINDHFWVMFLDPEYDISTTNEKLLLFESNKLYTPTEDGSNVSIFKSFNEKYRNEYASYVMAKNALYKINNSKPNKNMIWKGDNADDAPVLTIYRHFDSASVLKGVIGQKPKTMWVMDYSLLESIYYSLVAGFDIFGNATHQLNTRRYMDYLRIDGEIGLLRFIKQSNRDKIFKSWYIDDDKDCEIIIKLINEKYYDESEDTKYNTPYEFMEDVVNNHILKSTNINFDFNYKNNIKDDNFPKIYDTDEKYEKAFQIIGKSKNSIEKTIEDNNFNLIYVRVLRKNKDDKVFSMIVNRWHSNVNSLFKEHSRLNKIKNTMDVQWGLLGSYPNYYIIVKEENLNDFFNLFNNFNGTMEEYKKLDKYGLKRSNKDFWKYHDWFQEYLNKTQPLNKGLYDLNRYYYEAD